MKVFTFWEGKMPAYVELCMKTWKIPYVLLNYENVNQYTDIPIDYYWKLKDKYTLPQIADYVRVHVLRDNGGFWLDTDTIMLKNKLPVTNMLGYPNERAAHIGYLNATRDVGLMFKKWAEYQDDVLNQDFTRLSILNAWDIMGNRFSDVYIKKNKNVSIGFVQTRTPEVTFIRDESIPRKAKYEAFYFNTCQHLSDFVTTDILMLHNSWTPAWYKNLTREEVLANDCTLSNILKEVLS